MPLMRRVLALSIPTVFSLAAQDQASFVPVGDNAAWATVGLVLTGVSYGCVKVLDRLNGRSQRNTETTARK
jgi:sorbitol-specific phosphotransferase system component IIBC